MQKYYFIEKSNYYWKYFQNIFKKMFYEYNLENYLKILKLEFLKLEFLKLGSPKLEIIGKKF